MELDEVNEEVGCFEDLGFRLRNLVGPGAYGLEELFLHKGKTLFLLIELHREVDRAAEELADLVR